jgi:hypothetical protein
VLIWTAGTSFFFAGERQDRRLRVFAALHRTHVGTRTYPDVQDEAVKRVFQAGTVVFAFRRVLNKPATATEEEEEDRENAAV